ncbi:nicotinate phosphoribosyltransferase [Marasmius tenuissimus]|nr:nicotinate phosphoribosyltransferase [Marasmius tenuissimus]
MSKLAAPQSILDTDLYKLTMQQAVLQHFPSCQVDYRFTNRNRPHGTFSRACYEALASSVSQFRTLSLTHDERSWLSKACPYFTPQYLDYLENYRFKPEQVDINFVPVEGNEAGSPNERGHIEITATGPWVETILWETPLMACLSESYFVIDDTDWNYGGQEVLAFEKGKALLEAGCAFNEFGTRRRRSYKNQDIVVKGLVKASQEIKGPGTLLGTSNTFVNSPERARRWDGLRQDSGDPFVYAQRAHEVYKSMGIDHSQKLIIYSDSLDVEKAIALKKLTDEVGFRSSFGIGTSLTNDFKKASSGGKEKSKALNIVIKLASVDGKPCVKISDELSKNTGDQTTAEEIKRIFGLPVAA